MDDKRIHNLVERASRMHALRRVFEKFAALWKTYFKNDIKSHALEESPLGNLPLELILLITNFLPAESAAAFSFSCHPIHAILGQSHWEALRITSPEASSCKKAFLSLLEKDMPDHIACQACVKLHKVSKSFIRRNRGRDLACRDKDRWTDTHNLIHEDFHYPIFQMAMERHRLGLDCTKWLELLSYEHTGPCYGHMYQDTASARIIRDSLCVRAQHIYILPYGETVRIPTHLVPRVYDQATAKLLIMFCNAVYPTRIIQNTAPYAPELCPVGHVQQSFDSM